MLTKQQRDYAAKRIEEIYREKTGALKTPSTEYSAHEVMALIKSGNAKPTERSRRYRMSACNGQLELSLDITDAEHEAAKAKYENSALRLKTEKTRIMDQLNLGDAEQALKMIEAFAKF